MRDDWSGLKFNDMELRSPEPHVGGGICMANRSLKKVALWRVEEEEEEKS
jgi:hypothetical protein